jgi:hypothetical protein
VEGEIVSFKGARPCSVLNKAGETLPSGFTSLGKLDPTHNPKQADMCNFCADVSNAELHSVCMSEFTFVGKDRTKTTE